MQASWRTLTPHYAEGMSRDNLFVGDSVFAASDTRVSVQNPQPPHWHDAYEFGYVLTGTGMIVMGDREYPYVPGQVYIINDFEPHMGYADGDTSILFAIHFHPCILESGWIGQMRQEARTPFLPQFGRRSPLLPLDHPLTAPVLAILQGIRHEVQLRQPLWDVIVCSQVLHAVGLLARDTYQGEPLTYEELARRRALKTLQPVLRLLQARYHEALALEELADAAGLSASYCCELFSKALGVSPIAYRNHLRINEAQRLLQQSDMTIRAVAYQVGFQSVQELNRLFRRVMCCTPSQFQAKMRT